MKNSYLYQTGHLDRRFHPAGTHSSDELSPFGGALLRTCGCVRESDGRTFRYHRSGLPVYSRPLATGSGTGTPISETPKRMLLMIQSICWPTSWIISGLFGYEWAQFPGYTLRSCQL